MIITEADLRSWIRHPRPGQSVTVPAGARLTPSAADFVKQWDVVLIPGDEPGLVADASLPPDRSADRIAGAGGRVVPDDPGTFDDSPQGVARAMLGTRLATVHATILFIQRAAHDEGRAQLCSSLGALADFCSLLIAAEATSQLVDGLAAPGDDLSPGGEDCPTTPPPIVGVDDPLLQHRLNRVRCEIREIEVLARQGFGSCPPAWAMAVRQGLHQLGAVVECLQLELKGDTTR